MIIADIVNLYADVLLKFIVCDSEAIFNIKNNELKVTGIVITCDDRLGR